VAVHDVQAHDATTDDDGGAKKVKRWPRLEMMDDEKHPINSIILP
jgi:hypothetical protein